MSLKKFLTVSAAGALVAAGLAGCATNNGSSEAPKTSASASAATSAAPSAAMSGDTKKDDAEAPAPGADAANQRPDKCGNQEQDGPIADLGVFHIALHYFQPAVMVVADGSTMKVGSYKDSQMHFELDTKATKYATNWGYSEDETPANLHIMYKITDKDNKVLNEGMMMEMNAIDGSHYGVNLPNNTIPGPGDYKLAVTIMPPVNYGLHQDYKTGAPAKGWFKPLSAVMDWKVSQIEFDTVTKAKVADPMVPSEECAKYPMHMWENKDAQAKMEAAEAVPALKMEMGK